MSKYHCRKSGKLSLRKINPITEKQKNVLYESICYEICNIMNPYETLVENEVVHFMSTSFVRGININDCVVVVDECQNLTWHEYHSIMTRLGDKTQIIFCGDFRQSDFNMNRSRKEVTGLNNMMMVVERMKSFSCISFEKEDIVRSKIVKEFIIACDELEL